MSDRDKPEALHVQAPLELGGCYSLSVNIPGEPTHWDDGPTPIGAALFSTVPKWLTAQDLRDMARDFERAAREIERVEKLRCSGCGIWGATKGDYNCRCPKEEAESNAESLDT
jgi:hypothetical protein